MIHYGEPKRLKIIPETVYLCARCGKEFLLSGRAKENADRILSELDPFDTESSASIYCSQACRKGAIRNKQKAEQIEAIQSLYPGYVIYSQNTNTQTNNIQLILLHKHTKHKIHITQARYNMQIKLGRLLLPTERVKHVDADSLNNSPDNLELF